MALLCWYRFVRAHQVKRYCSEHPNTALIYERGGDDMPTIYGRWYCPKCQILLNEALDAQEKKK